MAQAISSKVQNEKKASRKNNARINLEKLSEQTRKTIIHKLNAEQKGLQWVSSYLKRNAARCFFYFTSVRSSFALCLERKLAEIGVEKNGKNKPSACENIFCQKHELRCADWTWKEPTPTGERCCARRERWFDAFDWHRCCWEWISNCRLKVEL